MGDHGHRSRAAFRELISIHVCLGLASIWTLICSLGCDSDSELDKTLRVVLPTAASEDFVPDVADVSQREADTFVIAWAKAFSDGNASDLQPLVDTNAIVDRMVDRLSLASTNKEQFRKLPEAMLSNVVVSVGRTV